jgi:hypothetical protein
LADGGVEGALHVVDFLVDEVEVEELVGVEVVEKTLREGLARWDCGWEGL